MTDSSEELADINALLSEFRVDVGDKQIDDWLGQGESIGRRLGFVNRAIRGKIFNLVQVSNYLNISYVQAKKYEFGNKSAISFIDYVPICSSRLANRDIRDICIVVGIERYFERGIAECVLLESIYPFYKEGYTAEQIAGSLDSDLRLVEAYLPKLQAILSATQSSNLYEMSCKDGAEEALRKRLKWEGELKELPAAELEGKVYALAAFGGWSYNRIAEWSCQY